MPEKVNETYLLPKELLSWLGGFCTFFFISYLLRSVSLSSSSQASSNVRFFVSATVVGVLFATTDMVLNRQTRTVLATTARDVALTASVGSTLNLIIVITLLVVFGYLDAEFISGEILTGFVLAGLSTISFFAAVFPIRAVELLLRSDTDRET